VLAEKNIKLQEMTLKYYGGFYYEDSEEKEKSNIKDLTLRWVIAEKLVKCNKRDLTLRCAKMWDR
jgi:uncharacterized protein YjaG (DUF416 family)